jgi:hypothetical protein
MNINVTVENQGDFTETFNVTLYANTTVMETKQITLTCGASTTVTFTWNTTGFAKGNYTIWAYAWPVQGEIDTADNTFTYDGIVYVGIPGDIDANGKVDILDGIILSTHFGHSNGNNHTPQTPEWWDCLNTDINNDNKTNILDAIILSANFGTKDP